MTYHFFNDLAFLFIKKLQKWIYTYKKYITVLIQVLILTQYQIKTDLQSDSQTHKIEIEQFQSPSH